MGRAIEIISGKVVNASSTFTSWTMATGDSATVRSFPFQTSAWLEDAWVSSAAAGLLAVHSPRMHDNVQGIRMGVLAATPQPLLPDAVRQRLYPQDTLVIQETGGASETDTGSLLVAYDDIPGIAADIRSWAEIEPLIQNLLTVETQHTTGGTAGDYGGSLAINANFDLLKANTPYAILGYLTSVAVASVGWRSPNFGNLRVGGPGTSQRVETRDYFVRRSQVRGEPWVPVFNSANKGSTFVDLLATQTSTAVVVQTILAQLSS